MAESDRTVNAQVSNHKKMKKKSKNKARRSNIHDEDSESVQSLVDGIHCLDISRDGLYRSVHKVLSLHHGIDVNSRMMILEPRFKKPFSYTKHYHFNSIFLGKVTIDVLVKERGIEDYVYGPPPHEETKEVILPIAIKKLSKHLFNELSVEQKLYTLEGFQREVLVNERVIGQIDNYRQTMVRNIPNAPHFKHLFPLCYGVTPGAADFDSNYMEAVLVLENLSEDFVKLDPVTGLNFNNAKFIVEKIAMFHATIMSMKVADASLPLDSYHHPGKNMCKYLKRSYIYSKTEVTEIMAEVNKITALEANRKAILAALNYSLQENKFRDRDKCWKTLSHEKLSLHNIVVKLNEDKQITDCKFLDLKHITKGNILSDLAFFLTTSLSKGVLKENFKEICEIYYESLKAFSITVSFCTALDTDLSYDNFLQHLKWNFKATLLKSIYQLKYLCCKEEDREHARSLADIPYYYLSQADSNKYLDRNAYTQKMYDVFSELIDLDLIDEPKKSLFGSSFF